MVNDTIGSEQRSEAGGVLSEGKTKDGNFPGGRQPCGSSPISEAGEAGGEILSVYVGKTAAIHGPTRWHLPAVFYCLVKF